MMRMIYVNEHFLGGKEIAREWGLSEADSSIARSSLSFASPSSGEIWARCPCLDGDRVMPYFILTKPGVGEGHRSSYGPSGSLLSAGAWMVHQLPHEALRLELLIHCDWAMSRPTNLEEFLSCPKSSPQQASSSAPTCCS